MRRRVLLLVAATTSLVLVAFLVPLALLVRTVAAERAVLAATADAQALTALVAVADPAALAVAVAQVDATSAAPGQRVHRRRSRCSAPPAPRTPLVELAARGSSASGIVDGGREIVFAVRDPAGRTGVIRTFVTDAALTAGVGRAWLLLAVLGVVLLAVSLLVADRLARGLVRATIDVAAVSHRLARGELDARAEPGRAGRGRRGGRGAEHAGRADQRAAARGAGDRRRPLAPRPHPAHRAAARRRGPAAGARTRPGSARASTPCSARSPR